MFSHTLYLTLSLIVLQALSLNTALDFECGIRKVGVKELIVNGYDTDPGHWPWHAAIFLKDARTPSYACGGTLISNQFVLTAAHCVVRTNGYLIASNLVFVRLGVHDLDEINGRIQQHKVQEIYTTGKFSRDGHPDDIALLQLSTRAKFDNYVQPACLNQMKDLAGKFGTAVGWGLTEHDTISQILKAAQLPAIDTVTCIKDDPILFANVLNDGIFCAGYKNGTTVCNGDSGGGLFFKQGNAWYLGGIISYAQQREDKSYRCDTHGYGAFTRVYSYLEWIKSITKLQTSYLSPLPEDCGLSIVDRIADGNAARVFAYPWIAKVSYKKQSGQFGSNPGTLISKRYVLASGYIIDYYSESLIDVVLGEHTNGQNIDCNIFRDSTGAVIDKQCAGPTETIPIESSSVHPDFKQEEDKADIGLVRLSRDVIMKDHIRPVCLPVTASLRSVQFDNYIFFGWRHKNPRPGYLQEGVAPWVSNADCQASYATKLTSAHLCATDNVRITCVTAPGSPLGYPANYNGIRFVQFAVKAAYKTSDCNTTSDPSLYTRVASYMDWITASIKP